MATAPQRKALWIGLSLLALVAVVGAITWAALTARNDGTRDARATDAAFVSAMKKLGVSAEPPTTPVEVTQVVPTGSHRISATLTPLEVAAIMSAFPFTYETQGTSISLSDVTLETPERGVATVDARLAAGSDSYRARMTIPLAFTMGHITSEGITALAVEGVPISGQRRDDASAAVVTYLDAYLAAAPGLEVSAASILEGGVFVTGTAPDSLAYP